MSAHLPPPDPKLPERRNHLLWPTCSSASRTGPSPRAALHTRKEGGYSDSDQEQRAAGGHGPGPDNGQGLLPLSLGQGCDRTAGESAQLLTNNFHTRGSDCLLVRNQLEHFPLCRSHHSLIFFLEQVRSYEQKPLKTTRRCSQAMVLHTSTPGNKYPRGPQAVSWGGRGDTLYF